MGKKTDALLGRRHLNTSKFKVLVKLSVSRLAVLKNQRLSRCSLARSDVIQLLNLGNHDSALLRVEQIIKEQNMRDVFSMIEGYCHLLVERTGLIEKERVCPEELKEAVSSLVYASTRCGEFPELQEIRAVFISRFGKEFVSNAIELRNNCGVNPKMVQKLSTRRLILENRTKLLKEIASENNIVLRNEEDSWVATEEKVEIDQKQNHPESTDIIGGFKLCDDFHNFPNGMEDVEGLPHSMKVTRKYKNATDAAEVAFKSASYAAAAARAAMELSKSHGPDDKNNRGPDHRNVTDKNNSMKSNTENTEKNASRRNEDQNVALNFEKVHPIHNFHSKSEDEIHSDEKDEESKEAELMPLEGIVFDESDDEMRNERGGVQLSLTHELSFDMKHSLKMDEALGCGKGYTIQDDDLSEMGIATLSRSQKRFPLRSQAGMETESMLENTKANSSEGSRVENAYRLNAGNKPVSVRTRRAQGR